MGKPIVSQFQKRFSDRITVIYADKPRSVVEEQTQGEVLAKAITQVMSEILGREPTQEELLGIKPIYTPPVHP